jgi:hypothetical protein
LWQANLYKAQNLKKRAEFAKRHLDGIVAPFTILTDATVKGRWYPFVILQNKLRVDKKLGARQKRAMIRRLAERGAEYADTLGAVDMGRDAKGSLYLLDISEVRPIESRQGARLARESTDLSRIYTFLTSKFGIRYLAHGGPILQPDFFRPIQTDRTQSLNKLIEAYGEEKVVDLSYDASIAQDAEPITIEEIAAKILSGELSLPLIYKPNLEANGARSIFIDRSATGRWALTMAHSSSGLYSVNVGYEKVREALRPFPEVFAIVDDAKDIFQISFNENTQNFSEILKAIHEAVSVVEYPGHHVEVDRGLIETAMKFITHQGRAFETRYAFAGNFQTGSLEFLKDQDWRMRWFGRLGSSPYYSNQTGRGSVALYEYPRMYDPLYASMEISDDQKAVFEKRIEDLIKNEIDFIMNRLRSKGVELGPFRGQLDLAWLPPDATSNGFPRPVLIEALFEPAEQKASGDGARLSANGDSKLIPRISKELDRAFKMHSIWPRAIVGFGSARSKPGDANYEMARRFGYEAGKRGFSAITGAGPGIMEAFLAGYIAGRDERIPESYRWIVQMARKIAIRLIRLIPRQVFRTFPDITQGVKIEMKKGTDSFEQNINPFVESGISQEHFITRKFGLYGNAQAYFVFPGGIGTVDEMFDAWKRSQRSGAPLVFIGKEYWQPRLDVYLKQWREAGLMNQVDRRGGFVITDDPDTAFDAVTKASMSRPILFSDEKAMAMNREVVASLKSISKLPRAITVIGRPRKKSPVLNELKRLTQMVTADGEVMRAANRGPVLEAMVEAVSETQAKKLQAVVNINQGEKLTPNEQKIRERSIYVEDESNHQLVMSANSHLYVVLPGAVGTMSKLWDLVTIMQTASITEKQTTIKPIILMGKKFWEPILEDVFTAMERDGMVSKGDRDLLVVVDTAQEAYDKIKQWRAQVAGAQKSGARLAGVVPTLPGFTLAASLPDVDAEVQGASVVSTGEGLSRLEALLPDMVRTGAGKLYVYGAYQASQLSQLVHQNDLSDLQGHPSLSIRNIRGEIIRFIHVGLATVRVQNYRTKNQKAGGLELRDKFGNLFSIYGMDKLREPKERFSEFTAKAHEAGLRVAVDFIPWLSPDAINASNYRWARERREVSEDRQAEFRKLKADAERRQWLEDLSEANPGFAVVRISEDGVERVVLLKHLYYGMNVDQIELDPANPQVQEYWIKALSAMVDLGADEFRVDLASHLILNVHKGEPLWNVMDAVKRHAAVSGKKVEFFTEGYEDRDQHIQIGVDRVYSDAFFKRLYNNGRSPNAETLRGAIFEALLQGKRYVYYPSNFDQLSLAAMNYSPEAITSLMVLISAMSDAHIMIDLRDWLGHEGHLVPVPGGNGGRRDSNAHLFATQEEIDSRRSIGELKSLMSRSEIVPLLQGPVAELKQDPQAWVYWIPSARQDVFALGWRSQAGRFHLAAFKISSNHAALDTTLYLPNDQNGDLRNAFGGSDIPIHFSENRGMVWVPAGARLASAIVADKGTLYHVAPGQEKVFDVREPLRLMVGDNIHEIRNGSLAGSLTFKTQPGGAKRDLFANTVYSVAPEIEITFKPFRFMEHPTVTIKNTAKWQTIDIEVMSGARLASNDRSDPKVWKLLMSLVRKPSELIRADKLPDPKLSSTAASEWVDALGLDDAKQIRRVLSPALEERGLTVYRISALPILTAQLGKYSDFDLVYGRDGALVGIFPASPQFMIFPRYYYDLSEYRVPIRVLKDVANSSADPHDWPDVLTDVEHAKADLESYKNATRYAGFKSRHLKNERQKTWMYAEVDMKTLSIWARRLDLAELSADRRASWTDRIFSRDKSVARVLLPNYPSVYPFAGFFERPEWDTDTFFYKTVLEKLSGLSVRQGERRLDAATGSGFVAWLHWLVLQAKGAGDDVQLYAYDADALSIANAKMFLWHIVGAQNIHLALGDSMRVFGDQSYRVVTANSPAAQLVDDSYIHPQDEKHWDGASAGALFTEDMKLNLLGGLDVDGFGIFWNGLPHRSHFFADLLRESGLNVSNLQPSRDQSAVYLVERSGARLATSISKQSIPSTDQSFEYWMYSDGIAKLMILNPITKEPLIMREGRERFIKNISIAPSENIQLYQTGESLILKRDGLVIGFIYFWEKMTHDEWERHPEHIANPKNDFVLGGWMVDPAHQKLGLTRLLIDSYFEYVISSGKTDIDFTYVVPLPSLAYQLDGYGFKPTTNSRPVFEYRAGLGEIAGPESITHDTPISAYAKNGSGRVQIYFENPFDQAWFMKWVRDHGRTEIYDYLDAPPEGGRQIFIAAAYRLSPEKKAELIERYGKGSASGARLSYLNQGLYQRTSLSLRQSQKVGLAKLWKAYEDMLRAMGSARSDEKFSTLVALQRADTELLDQKAVGMVIGSHAIALWNKKTGEADLDALGRVSIVVLSRSFEPKPIAGVRWFVPVDAEASLTRSYGYERKVRHQMLVDPETQVALLATFDLYPERVRLDLKNGLYLASHNFLSYLAVAQARLKFGALPGVEIDEEVISKFEDKVLKTLKSGISPVWRSRFMGDQKVFGDIKPSEMYIGVDSIREEEMEAILEGNEFGPATKEFYRSAGARLSQELPDRMPSRREFFEKILWGSVKFSPLGFSLAAAALYDGRERQLSLSLDEYEIRVELVNDALRQKIAAGELIYIAPANPYYIEGFKRIPSGLVVSNGVMSNGPNRNTRRSPMQSELVILWSGNNPTISANTLGMREAIRRLGAKQAMQVGPLLITDFKIREEIRAWYRGFFHGRLRALGFDHSKMKLYYREFKGPDRIGFFGRFFKSTLFADMANWQRENNIEEAVALDGGTADLDGLQKSPVIIVAAPKSGARLSDKGQGEISVPTLSDLKEVFDANGYTPEQWRLVEIFFEALTTRYVKAGSAPKLYPQQYKRAVAMAMRLMRWHADIETVAMGLIYPFYELADQRGHVIAMIDATVQRDVAWQVNRSRGDKIKEVLARIYKTDQIPFVAKPRTPRSLPNFMNMLTQLSGVDLGNFLLLLAVKMYKYSEMTHVDRFDNATSEMRMYQTMAARRYMQTQADDIEEMILRRVDPGGYERADEARRKVLHGMDIADAEERFGRLIRDIQTFTDVHRMGAKVTGRIKSVMRFQTKTSVLWKYEPEEIPDPLGIRVVAENHSAAMGIMNEWVAQNSEWVHVVHDYEFKTDGWHNLDLSFQLGDDPTERVRLEIQVMTPEARRAEKQGSIKPAHADYKQGQWWERVLGINVITQSRPLPELSDDPETNYQRQYQKLRDRIYVPTYALSKNSGILLDMDVAELAEGAMPLDFAVAQGEVDSPRADLLGVQPHQGVDTVKISDTLSGIVTHLNATTVLSTGDIVLPPDLAQKNRSLYELIKKVKPLPSSVASGAYQMMATAIALQRNNPNYQKWVQSGQRAVSYALKADSLSATGAVDDLMDFSKVAGFLKDEDMYAAIGYSEKKLGSIYPPSRFLEAFNAYLRSDRQALPDMSLSGARLASTGINFEQAYTDLSGVHSAADLTPEIIAKYFSDQRMGGAIIGSPRSYQWDEAGGAYREIVDEKRTWNSRNLQELFLEGKQKIHDIAYDKMDDKFIFDEADRRMLEQFYVIHFIAHQYFALKDSKRVHKRGGGTIPYALHTVDATSAVYWEFKRFSPAGGSVISAVGLAAELMHDVFEDTQLNKSSDDEVLGFVGLTDSARAKQALLIARTMTRDAAEEEKANDRKYYSRLIRSIENEYKDLSSPLDVLRYYATLILKMADKLTSIRFDMDAISDQELSQPEAAKAVLIFLNERMNFIKYFASYLIRSQNDELRNVALYWNDQYINIFEAQKERIARLHTKDGNDGHDFVESILEMKKLKPVSIRVEDERQRIWSAKGINDGSVSDPRRTFYQIRDVTADSVLFEDFQKIWPSLRDTYPPIWEKDWLKNPQNTWALLTSVDPSLSARMLFAKDASGEYTIPAGISLYTHTVTRDDQVKAAANTVDAIAVHPEYRGHGANHVLIEDLRRGPLKDKQTADILSFAISLSDKVNRKNGYTTIDTRMIEEVMHVGSTLIEGEEDTGSEGARLASAELLNLALSAYRAGRLHDANRQLEVFAQREDTTLYELNAAIALLPWIVTDYQDAFALYYKLTPKYRAAAVQMVARRSNLIQSQMLAVIPVMIRMYGDSWLDSLYELRAREELSGVSDRDLTTLVNNLDLLKDGLTEAHIRINAKMMNDALVDIKPFLQSFHPSFWDRHLKGLLEKKQRLSPSEQLAWAVRYFQVVYDIRLSVPLAGKAQPNDIPVYRGAPAEIYTINDLPDIMSKLIEIDNQLASLPRKILLRSLTMRKLTIVRSARHIAGFWEFSDLVDQNNIVLAMDYAMWKQVLFHEIGHSLHGPSGKFATYIDPARFREFVSQHRSFFVSHDPSFVLRVESVLKDEDLDVPVLAWQALNLIYKVRLEQWKKARSPQDAARKLLAPFGLVAQHAYPKPSVALRYIFEDPEIALEGKEHFREMPLELIAEYTQLYVLFPDELRKLDHVAYDFFSAILGSAHDASRVMKLASITPPAGARLSERGETLAKWVEESRGLKLVRLETPSDLESLPVAAEGGVVLVDAKRWFDNSKDFVSLFDRLEKAFRSVLVGTPISHPLKNGSGSESLQGDARVVLSEAISNANHYGNDERHESVVIVTWDIKPRELVMRVYDEAVQAADTDARPPDLSPRKSVVKEYDQMSPEEQLEALSQFGMTRGYGQGAGISAVLGLYRFTHEVNAVMDLNRRIGTEFIMRRSEGARLAGVQASPGHQVARSPENDDLLALSGFYGVRLTSVMAVAPEGMIPLAAMTPLPIAAGVSRRAFRGGTIPFENGGQIYNLTNKNVPKYDRQQVKLAELLGEDMGTASEGARLSDGTNSRFEQIHQYAMEQKRQAAVFARAFGELGLAFSEVQGLIEIDLGRFAEAGSHDPSSKVFQENITKMARAIDLMKSMGLSPMVKFYVYGHPDLVTYALAQGMEKYQVAPIERANAVFKVKITGTGSDQVERGKAFLSVAFADKEHGHAVYPILNYALYLLGIQNVKETATIENIDDRVITEVLKLSGREMADDRLLSPSDILDFALGNTDLEVLETARMYSVRALIPILGARLTQMLDTLKALATAA